MRLDKFLCKSTDLTRNEATVLIHNGGVVVNGAVVTRESEQVHENNRIQLNGEQLTARPSRYLMINKPKDTVCSNIDEAYPSLFNHVDLDSAGLDSSELHVAGRLDADTTGLVLATDDGRWSYQIITPNQGCPKTYRVDLRDEITDEVVTRFVEGVQLQGESGLTLPAQLQVLSPRQVLLTLTEGKYHQVKRMFKAVGNRVVALHRQQIGAVHLDIEVGCWRYLSADEIASFAMIES
ncbi:MAG: pseudouridine synthase [Motiliproteus sp.]